MGVKELYVSDGNVVGSTYVFMILEDGTPSLIWYMGNQKVEEDNPTISKRYDGSMKIEYGEETYTNRRKIKRKNNKFNKLIGT